MENSNLLSEIQRTFKEEINAIELAYERIDKSYTDAVEIISKANKIVLTGVGKSGLIAKKIAATFSSIGISSVFLHPVEALHGDIGIVQKGDAAILISKSGGTKELVKLVPYLKMQSAQIISIVGNMNSFLASNSDITLDGSVKREACPHNLVPTSSTTVALVIGDALAVAAMKYRNVTIENFARLHPLGQIGRNITVRIKDIMHKGGAMPVIKTGSKILDAILIISEKGLGCVCVTDDDDNLLGLITDGDLRRALQKEIDIRNAKVDSVMTQNPIVCQDNAFLGEVLAIMEQRPSQLSVMPVVNSENRLCGVVRIHDIILSGV
jgi:arabinose-5-phosphate isomerase